MHRKRVIFAGGGTGGHLYPAIALARALPSLESVFLVPHDRGDEERLNGEFRCVSERGPRYDVARWSYPARLAWSVRRCRRVLKRLDASAVVGLGGYASVPASIAARTLGLPLYLMECNAVPGKATRFLSRLASGIGLGAACARSQLRGDCLVTGTPLREELKKTTSPAVFGLRDEVPTLLVVGGSQGAIGLNRRVVAGLAECPGLGFQVLHCAGSRDAARVRAAYAELDIDARVVDYLQDIGRAYAAADLVLSRAGASTVAECLALGLPAVFVPYPWHKDRQQLFNAADAERAGAACIIEERALTPKAIRGIVKCLLLDDEALSRMAEASLDLGRPDAAKHMAAHFLETIGDALAEPGVVTELGG